MSEAREPFETCQEGIRLWVKANPAARRTAIEGLAPRADGGRSLKVSLTAAPADGKANAALIALLAKSFGLAKRQVEILRGGSERQKVILLKGDGPRLARQAKSLY